MDTDLLLQLTQKDRLAPTLGMLRHRNRNVCAHAPGAVRLRDSDPDWAHLMGLGGRQLGHLRVKNPSGYYWSTHKCLTWTYVGYPACILGPAESHPESPGGLVTLGDFFRRHETPCSGHRYEV